MKYTCNNCEEECDSKEEPIVGQYYCSKLCEEEMESNPGSPLEQARMESDYYDV